MLNVLDTQEDQTKVNIREWAGRRKQKPVRGSCRFYL